MTLAHATVASHSKQQRKPVQLTSYEQVICPTFGIRLSGLGAKQVCHNPEAAPYGDTAITVLFAKVTQFFNIFQKAAENLNCDLGVTQGTFD